MTTRPATVVATLAAAVALAATAPAATATPAPADPTKSAQQTESARSAPNMVRLVLRTPNCPRCKLTITKWRPGQARWHRTKRVHDRRAVFNVARGRTKGMQIVVDSPGRTVISDGAGIRLTAMRYQGRKPGSRVTPKQARRARAGFSCWRGAPRRHHEIILRVDRFRARDASTNELGTDIRAYALKGTRTVGPARRAPRGALGAQDWGGC